MSPLWDAKIEDLAKRLYIEHAENLGDPENSKKIANGCIASAAAFYEALEERRSEIKSQSMQIPSGSNLDLDSSGLMRFAYFDNDVPAKYGICSKKPGLISCVYNEPAQGGYSEKLFHNHTYPAWATAKFMHNNKIFVSSTERMQFDEEKQVWFSPYPNTKIAECFNEICLVSAKNSLVTLDLPF